MMIGRGSPSSLSLSHEFDGLAEEIRVRLVTHP
jgi:hypothetical protein